MPAGMPLRLSSSIFLSSTDPTTLPPTAGPSPACILSALAATLSQAAPDQARLDRRVASGQALSRRSQAPLAADTHPNVIYMTSRNRQSFSMGNYDVFFR